MSTWAGVHHAAAQGSLSGTNSHAWLISPMGIGLRDDQGGVEWCCRGRSVVGAGTAGWFGCGLPLAIAVGVAATMLGGPWMGAVGMSRSKQIGPEFQTFDFTYDRRTHQVFRRGSGPAVLVLHEIPGLHPGVIDFARRLIAAGYTVYLPSLFGRPAAPANGREVVRSILRVCVAREFTKLADRTSAVVGWLRALAASAYRECGGPGVGVVGMCFTGGFALATALEPSVVASVMSQPDMPAPIGERGRAALGLDAEDLSTIMERANDGLRVLGLRFSNDRGCPPERFETLRATLGTSFEGIEIDTLLEICEGTSTKITRWPLRITTPRLPATNSQTTPADAAES